MYVQSGESEVKEEIFTATAVLHLTDCCDDARDL